ncbi:hypothetical protein GIB67_011852 [Kingdonia uniflora]|uniref:Pentatricopeptide repeat-containing protein n=1 Tax=Kingdonia uniflora TaxID=39325 RepID=A0A7J7MJS5_9MAGN|nr:hypothetical protein GIB67_011852 [Kingdonia uniflora]
MRSTSLFTRRNFSSILNPNSTTPLSTKEKSRCALSLLKSEKNPQKILDICRAAALTPESHLDRIAFTLAISNLTASNSFDTIRSFLEKLKTRPDLKTERFFNYTMLLYGKADMLENAVQTFKKMEEMGVARSVKSLNALLDSCVVAKKFDEVNRIFLDFPTAYGITPDLDTYNIVIRGFCASGSSNSVYSMLVEMKEKGVKPNVATFGNILTGFYKEEKYEEVENVLKLMTNHGVTYGVSIENIRIHSLCKLKRSNEAKMLLDGLVKKGLKPNSDTYNHLIFGFCKEGNLKEAKNLVSVMKKKWFLSRTYFTLIYYLCKGEDFDTALTLFTESMAKNWVPSFSTMKSLVDGLVKNSKSEEARGLVKIMKERFNDKADPWNEIEQGIPS